MSVGSEPELRVAALTRDNGLITVLKAALAQSGDRLSVMGDLEELVDLASSVPPEVVLVDLSPGDPNALAAVHHVRALSPRTAVIALTPPALLELGARALSLGSAGILVLPLSGDDILTALTTQRELRALRTALRESRDSVRITAKPALGSALKDPDSCTYTLAYFVDVVRREIERGNRYGRRFSLATIGVERARPWDSDERDPSLEAAKCLLGALRDTDVLARADDAEFYLLLPETGGLGAQACRRRVLERLRAAGLRVNIGIAHFPHDGADLSRLLRVAKQRGHASLRSVVERHALEPLGLPELLDVLLANLRTPPAPLEASHYYIELPPMDAVELALRAVREAGRAGETRVIATQHAGISLGGAVRAEVQHELDDVRLSVIDVSPLRGAENADLLLVLAEHSCYALAGRTEGNLVRAVHSTDPQLTDLLTARLGEASGVRLFEA